MWSATERDVMQMELGLDFRSRKKEIDHGLLPKPDLALISRDLCAADFVPEVRCYKGGMVRVYLADRSIISVGGNDYLVLLLSISDRRRPNHVLSDPEKALRREIQRNGNEGNDHSCHIVIRQSPTMNGGASYRMAVEQVPLFPLDYIGRYLNRMVRDLSFAKNYSVPHPAGVRENGVPVMVPVRVAAEQRAVPSDELLRDLKNGVLADIELSREIPGAHGFDEHGYTIDRRSSLVVEPRGALNVSIPQIIENVFSTARSKAFTIAKVRWKNGDRTTTARFDCDSGSPLQNRYIKRLSIKLDESLPASCNKIDQHLARRMVAWISLES